MKKMLGKIIGIVSILVLGCQHFCYADSITHFEYEYYEPFLTGFIGVILLIIIAISFLSLKAIVGKQKETEQNIDSENKNGIQIIFYILGMILSFVGLVYLGLSEKISREVFLELIIIFDISFIVRLNGKKKVSNIICVISLVLICLVVTWVGISDKMTENYNEQFLQYVKYESRYWIPYVSDTKELINAVKNNNNESERKTTIIYNGSQYTSSEELEKLLSKISSNKKYRFDYHKNYGYIESISLDIIDTKENSFLVFDDEQ